MQPSLGNKLLQLAQGAIYDTDKNVIDIHSREKEGALDRIIEEANGQPILVSIGSSLTETDY